MSNDTTRRMPAIKDPRNAETKRMAPVTSDRDHLSNYFRIKQSLQ